MPKIRSRLAVALVTFLLGITVTTVFLFKSKDTRRQHDANATVQGAQGLHLIIPNAKWEPLFFSSFDEYTKEINLPSLRTVVLPSDDLEVRFWYDGRPYVIDAIIIRRSGRQWTATHLHGTFEDQPFRLKQQTLPAPKSGWKEAWGKLMDAGILTLPDESEVQCYSGALDGVGYVVEVNMNNTYKIYRYDNPQLAECKEAKQMVSIEEIMSDEFGLSQKLESSSEKH